MKGDMTIYFFQLINLKMKKLIIDYTSTEYKRINSEDFDFSSEKLDAILAILLARRAYQAKNLNIKFLWNEKLSPLFFAQVMSRDNQDSNKILKYLRFDSKKYRSF